MPEKYNNINEIPGFMFSTYADLVNSYRRGEIDIKTSIYYETLKVASHFSWKAGLIGLASLFLEIIYIIYCVITGTFLNLVVVIPFHISTAVLRKPIFVSLPPVRVVTIILMATLSYIYFTMEIPIFGLIALAIGLAWVLNIVWYAYSEYIVKKISLSDEKLFCNLFSVGVVGIYNHSSREIITIGDFVGDFRQ